MEKEYRGKFIGIDNDPEMLNNRVEIFPAVLGDGNTLPFKDESFDSLISVDTMHLIKGNDFARVLKKGGLALFTIFFNDENYEQRRQLLRERVKPLAILQEFDTHTREKEHVIIAVKPAGLAELI
jgi:ubiquinone/menaquinone biosynthesis C-methylase UbiE